MVTRWQDFHLLLSIIRVHCRNYTNLINAPSAIWNFALWPATDRHHMTFTVRHRHSTQTAILTRYWIYVDLLSVGGWGPRWLAFKGRLTRSRKYICIWVKLNFPKSSDCRLLSMVIEFGAHVLNKRRALFTVVAFIHGIDCVTLPLLSSAGLVSYAGLRLPQSPTRSTGKASAVSRPPCAGQAIRWAEGKTGSHAAAVWKKKKTKKGKWIGTPDWWRETREGAGEERVGMIYQAGNLN